MLTIRKIRDHCRSLVSIVFFASIPAIFASTLHWLQGIPVRIVTSCIDPTIEIEDDILLVPSVGVPFAEKEQVELDHNDYIWIIV